MKTTFTKLTLAILVATTPFANVASACGPGGFGGFGVARSHVSAIRTVRTPVITTVPNANPNPAPPQTYYTNSPVQTAQYQGAMPAEEPQGMPQNFQQGMPAGYQQGPPQGMPAGYQQGPPQGVPYNNVGFNGGGPINISPNNVNSNNGGPNNADLQRAMALANQLQANAARQAKAPQQQPTQQNAPPVAAAKPPQNPASLGFGWLLGSVGNSGEPAANGPTNIGSLSEPAAPSNQTANVALSDLGLADIRLIDVGNPSQGLGPAYRVTIKNIGSAPAAAFQVGLIASLSDKPNKNAARASAPANGLAAGETVTIDVRLPKEAMMLADETGKTAAFKNLIVVLDTRGQIQESDKQNNMVGLQRGDIPWLTDSDVAAK